MTLEQLASIGEIVSGIAVIISLVYLAIQIKTNTEAERSATYQSIVSDDADLLLQAGFPDLVGASAGSFQRAVCGFPGDGKTGS
jgi:hypothetical protein